MKYFCRACEGDYGVTGGVADWMASYLSDRHQSIDINGTYSDKIDLKYGFPQGSKIGPFGFKLYTKPLTSIARKHNIQIHLYADDTQLYTTFDPNNSAEAMKRMEACITEIKAWMANNLLKLNDSKTEFIIFGTAQDITKISQQSVTVGSAKVLPSKVMRDIGAMLDTSLTMKTHINSTTRSCYTQLRGISKIRKYLSQDSTKSLVHAYVTSRLDNMNSLLHALPDYLINKLQILQNNAARLITRQKQYCHITPFLIELHWLPIKFRIEYKILLLVYKCLHGGGPVYLASLLKEYCLSRALRSSNKLLLKEPRSKKKYGDRAFSVAGPKLWNALPEDLRNSCSVNIFKKHLKTHLFKKSLHVIDFLYFNTSCYLICYLL